MEWNEETIQRLRSLWQEGHSTAEIGRRMSITKNAVVGKAHRLVLPARPSPIRRLVRQNVGDAAQTAGHAPSSSRALPAAEAAGSVTPFSPRAAIQPPSTQPPSGPRLQADGQASPTNIMPLRRPAAAAAQAAAPGPAGDTAALPGDRSAPSRDADPDETRVRREASGASSFRSSAELPRRRSQSCCWPLGDPGTKQFHFCGCEPIPGKPYCVEHAQLAYVKLRDRRETVA